MNTVITPQTITKRTFDLNLGDTIVLSRDYRLDVVGVALAYDEIVVTGHRHGRHPGSIRDGASEYRFALNTEVEVAY